jgi:hypothetical protein
MADIFVSYTISDREWAYWIAKELEALGHVPHVYEWEIQGGDNIYAWMEERHDTADRVVCVVSDDYLRAPYSTLERHAALWQAAKKRPGFVLFVAVSTCKLPTLSDHIRRCEGFRLSIFGPLNLRNQASRPNSPDARSVPIADISVSAKLTI